MKNAKLILTQLVIVLGMTLSLPAMAQANPTPAAKADAPVGWEKVDLTDDGIEVYRKEFEGSPIVALRGEGVIDAPIERVSSVLLDKDRATEWVARMEESKVLKMHSEREFLQYIVIGGPAIVSDRDFVNDGKVEVNSKERTLTLKLTPPKDDPVPKTDHVRGVLNGYYKLRSLDDGKKTHIIAEMHADPKGSLPKFIVNFFQRNWAKDTIRNLRKQVAKPDIQIIPAVQKVFASKS